jgi:hypothetical protein
MWREERRLEARIGKWTVFQWFCSFRIEELDCQRSCFLVRDAIKRHNLIREEVLSIEGLSFTMISNNKSRAFFGQHTKSIITLHCDSILRPQASSRSLTLLHQKSGISNNKTQATSLTLSRKVSTSTRRYTTKQTLRIRRHSLKISLLVSSQRRPCRATNSSRGVQM